MEGFEMSTKTQCDMCGRLYPHGLYLNVVSFYKHMYNTLEPFTMANPRLELCDDCFEFLKKIVESSKDITIDDIRRFEDDRTDNR